ncbi:MAG: hypothetical protein ACI8QC_003345 [Planctomycetota bacterium]|jgi:hypothetical protein
MSGMSTWAEIRQVHSVKEVPKKQIARRLGVDVKTFRRGLSTTSPPARRANPKRGSSLDEHREEILELLTSEPKISAKLAPRQRRWRPDFKLHQRSRSSVPVRWMNPSSALLPRP